METSTGFSIGEVNEQLQRILNFYVFKNSHTLSKFLEYIVVETSNGRQQYLKEYSVAVDVLNRDVSFNSNDNAVVRIHAGRLRRALNEYYLTEGLSDLIFIHIPKGGYIPQFEPMSKSGEIKADIAHDIDVNPTVAVFPFKSILPGEESEMFSIMLGEELSAELSRFQDISVIGYHSVEMTAKINQNIIEAGKLVGADYIITGSVRYIDKKVRVRINLLITSTGEVVMTKTLDRDVCDDLVEIQDEIVKSFICEVGGYYGFIFQKMDKASPLKVNNNISTRKGINAYHQYQRTFSMENYNSAVILLEQAVKVNPDHALSWAMLGEIYLDSIPLRVKKVDNPIESGYRCAMQAIKLDPLCHHGWHSLTWAYLIKKEKESCLYSGLQCIEINPNGSIMTAGAALMLISAGYFEIGFPVMEQAVKKNLYYPWWMNMGFIFYYLHTGEYEMAYAWAEKMNAETTFWDPLLKSACLSYINEDDEAKKYLAKLPQLNPETPSEIKNMLATFILSEEIITQLIGGLERVGFQMVTD
ncbi:tetratricopeptide repeat protein [Mucilaginibacter jinjuensis]|uniref:TolB-like protein n=1 Tax=Mucilaginibacter jinjuensis TaxID=1176721 RepID=A0ABY7TD72_9SPHI|nr:hypothetical protein [Mucilaginibacter jinjuensis]WCT14465.1 hypothetical protein PQO05_11025 [Mucilaginibacter jinjuensis]